MNTDELRDMNHEGVNALLAENQRLRDERDRWATECQRLTKEGNTLRYGLAHLIEACDEYDDNRCNWEDVHEIVRTTKRLLGEGKR